MNVSNPTGVILHLNIDFARELGETPAWSFRTRALSRWDTKDLERSDWRIDSKSRPIRKEVKTTLEATYGRRHLAFLFHRHRGTASDSPPAKEYCVHQK